MGGEAHEGPMSEQPYRKPPITEAVIEIRYAEPIEPAQQERAITDLSVNYPIRSQVMNAGFAVGQVVQPNDPVAQFQLETGQRLSSSDLTELVLIWRPSIIVSQLAPYPGWDRFFDRFMRDWKVWKRVMGYRKISRIGLRYINRIDIPHEGRPVEDADFVRVHATLPEEFGPMLGYGLQVQLLPDDLGCSLTVNSASVPSPLLDHIAIMLDLDLGADAPPQSDEAIFSLLRDMRLRKNKVFEACVTDRARELFQR